MNKTIQLQDLEIKITKKLGNTKKSCLKEGSKIRIEREELELETPNYFLL
jgi:hypothetical protein